MASSSETSPPASPDTPLSTDDLSDNSGDLADDGSLTPAARILGYAGLLPQIICVTLAISGHEQGFVALFMGFVYAAVIFSFLGGVWWGQAIAGSGEAGAPKAGAGVYILAVLPSLIAAALFVPYNYGWDWPGPALLYLGAFIMLSPFVDRALGYADADFMKLRWQLSIGLGLLTIALGIAAEAMMQPQIPVGHELIGAHSGLI